jgi:chaperonin GroEL
MYKQHVKAKTAAKSITYEGSQLKHIVLDTLQRASKLVGSTLGPNGKLVLIERQEDMPPFVTKDGITVFNSMAFTNSTAQAVLEAARDSSSKTNVEAGDGTTTATILAAGLIKHGFDFLGQNPRLSTQKVMRELEQAYEELIVPFVRDNALKITNENSQDLLKKVALISTNNDADMAKAVTDCFAQVGHNGNVTIVEATGSGGFEVEKIEGLPIARGFEDSCGRFVEEFINDRGHYRTMLDKPKFILYNGRLNDITPLIPVLDKIGQAAYPVDETGRIIVDAQRFNENIVLVAHDFSERVLAVLAQNFRNPGTINVVPLKTPMSMQTNSQSHFLQDVAAFVGAKVFDPLSNPLENAQLADLGLETMHSFEFNRYKSTILGDPDELLIIARSEELQIQSQNAASSMDKELFNERQALLTGGIARLKVMGSSEAELKEKRHRVEDAVCAIKGALKDGVLPGCAKTLISLRQQIKGSEYSPAVKYIMRNAFIEPFYRIFANAEIPTEEVHEIFNDVMKDQQFMTTYDALNSKVGNAIELGIIDSASAVLCAIKNSLSVAKMLMGLSGIVVFSRDMETEIDNAKTLTAEERAIQEAVAQREKEDYEPRS